MRLPKHIRIGGHNVRIELVDEMIDGTASGAYSAEKNLIKLCINYPNSQVQATLIHELLHAINCNLTEIEVEFLAQALFQVLHDNKLVFDGEEVKQ